MRDQLAPRRTKVMNLGRFDLKRKKKAASHSSHKRAVPSFENA